MDLAVLQLKTCRALGLAVMLVMHGLGAVLKVGWAEPSSPHELEPIESDIPSVCSFSYWH